MVRIASKDVISNLHLAGHRAPTRITIQIFSGLANKKMYVWRKKKPPEGGSSLVVGGKLTLEIADRFFKFLDALFIAVLLREDLRLDELQHGGLLHFPVLCIIEKFFCNLTCGFGNVQHSPVSSWKHTQSR